MQASTAIVPNFIVVGANKGGTTSLYHYLKQHPEVYLSPIKEPHYFSKDIDVNQFKKEFAHNKLQDIDKYTEGDMAKEFHAAFVRDEAQYLRLFSKAGSHKAIGELSTSYLYSKVAAEEIKKINPSCKIIICLRNPIERAWSHYRMNLWTGNSNEFDFYKALLEDEHHLPKVWGNAHLYVDIGKYSAQVKRYLDAFGRDNVRILFSEDLRQNTDATIKDLYAFIGVDPQFKPDTSEHYNEVYTPKYKNITWFLNRSGIRPLLKRISPKGLKKMVVQLLYRNKSDKGNMSDEARRYLHEQLDDDIRALEKLLNKDLSAWLK